MKSDAFNLKSGDWRNNTETGFITYYYEGNGTQYGAPSDYCFVFKRLRNTARGCAYAIDWRQPVVGDAWVNNLHNDYQQPNWSGWVKIAKQHDIDVLNNTCSGMISQMNSLTTTVNGFSSSISNHESRISELESTSGGFFLASSVGWMDLYLPLDNTRTIGKLVVHATTESFEYYRERYDYEVLHRLFRMDQHGWDVSISGEGIVELWNEGIRTKTNPGCDLYINRKKVSEESQTYESWVTFRCDVEPIQQLMPSYNNFRRTVNYNIANGTYYFDIKRRSN